MMSNPTERRYFIVKHDIESFKLLPGFIWRTDILPPKMPRGFRLVEPGDVWIEFAHIKDERDREPCSSVTGFRRCVQGATYRPVPEGPVYPESDDWAEKGFAWMIEGEEFETQPRCDVIRHNAMPDHVHLLVRLPPAVSVSDFIGQVKGATAHRVNEEIKPDFKLTWQEGYGVLTLRKDELGKVSRYIDDREIHHQTGKLSVLLETIMEDESSPPEGG
jgi:putative transposase